VLLQQVLRSPGTQPVVGDDMVGISLVPLGPTGKGPLAVEVVEPRKGAPVDEIAPQSWYVLSPSGAAVALTNLPGNATAGPQPANAPIPVTAAKLPQPGVQAQPEGNTTTAAQKSPGFGPLAAVAAVGLAVVAVRRRLPGQPPQ